MAWCGAMGALCLAPPASIPQTRVYPCLPTCAVISVNGSVSVCRIVVMVTDVGLCVVVGRCYTSEEKKSCDREKAAVDK